MCAGGGPLLAYMKTLQKVAISLLGVSSLACSSGDGSVAYDHAHEAPVVNVYLGDWGGGGATEQAESAAQSDTNIGGLVDRRVGHLRLCEDEEIREEFLFGDSLTGDFWYGPQTPRSLSISGSGYLSFGETAPNRVVLDSYQREAIVAVTPEGFLEDESGRRLLALGAGSDCVVEARLPNQPLPMSPRNLRTDARTSP